MAKTEGTYIQVTYKNVFGHILTSYWPFFMIKRLTIREKCVWVRSNTWQDERLVATGLDRFFSVFRFFDKHCNWQPKNFRICATATSGPVFCSWVQFDFGLFLQSSELDLQTLMAATGSPSRTDSSGILMLEACSTSSRMSLMSWLNPLCLREPLSLLWLIHKE